MTERTLQELTAEVEDFHATTTSRPLKGSFRELLHKAQELGIRCTDWMLTNQTRVAEIDPVLARLKAAEEALAEAAPK